MYVKAPRFPNDLGYCVFPWSTLPLLVGFIVEATAHGILDARGQLLLRVRGTVAGGGAGDVVLLLSASATTAGGVPTAFLSVPALE